MSLSYCIATKQNLIMKTVNVDKKNNFSKQRVLVLKIPKLTDSLIKKAKKNLKNKEKMGIFSLFKIKKRSDKKLHNFPKIGKEFRAKTLEDSKLFYTWIINQLKASKYKIQKSESTGEIICRKYLEHVFNKSFEKTRPNYLKNPVTNSNLEIDCFCQELNLGLEYQGIQHYKFTPFFHKNKAEFQNQKYRDLIKKFLCEKLGINIIEVPYTINNKMLAFFIQNEIDKLIKTHKLISQ